MNERLPSAIGTVAEEAARLIEDMAAMARSRPSQDPRPYAGGPAHGRVPPDETHAPSHAAPDDPPDVPPYGWPSAAARDTPRHVPPYEDAAPADSPAGATSGVCPDCGGPRDGAPVACRLCPICQGISLMRSVRPETVDLLADLALAVAATLRDVASRSRASDQASARPAPGSSSDGGRTDGGRTDGGRTARGRADGGRSESGRTTVQDIPVNDDSEG
jgi:hypothetical protein